MKLVTDAVLAEKETELAELESELDVQRASLAGVSRGTALPTEYTRARDDVDLARAELDELRRRQTRQSQALAERVERERKAVKELTKLGKELQASREALLGQVAAAGRVILDALQAAADHDRTVVQLQVRLDALGLRMADVAEDVDHTTGVADLHAGARLAGHYWGRIDPAGLLAWLMHRTATAAFGRHTRAAELAKSLVGFSSLDRRTDGLLDGVPELPQLAATRPRPAPLMPPRPDRDPPDPGAAGPYLERIARDRQLVPDPDWRENHVREFGTPPPEDAA